VLDNPGKVSTEVAKALALEEHDKFNTRRLTEEPGQPDSDFERVVKEIEGKET
jgi:hypothetical protein